MVSLPALGALNVMHLANPRSAILSAVIFNALVIIALIPLALRGVRYRAIGAAKLLQRNLLIYGLGGIIAPFAGHQDRRLDHHHRRTGLRRPPCSQKSDLRSSPRSCSPCSGPRLSPGDHRSVQGRLPGPGRRQPGPRPLGGP
ncbi:MAG: hypothetical protein WDM92_07720 [Caulobacteraceae bacterium]